MASYHLESTAGNRDIEADEWKVENEFVVFLKNSSRIDGRPKTVFAVKATFVHTIELSNGSQ